MTDKQLFCGVLVLLVVAVLIVGAIGGDCVADCEARGSSTAHCLNMCRP